MKYGDFLRGQPGDEWIYECENSETRSRKNTNNIASAHKAGARVKQENLNAFDSKNQPRYLIKITLVKAGRPKAKPPGRPKGSKNKAGLKSYVTGE